MNTPTEGVLAVVSDLFFVARIRETARLAGVPVLGFTTHVLARQTEPWHARCARVVTKDALTQELPQLLRGGVGA